MDWRELWRRITPRRMIDSDVRDEIEFHIEERVQEMTARGVDEEEARRVVLERFGDRGEVEETCRAVDAQRVDGTTRRMTMDGWTRDLKLALRGMRRAPGFTAAVVTTLALGIGATTAVFSVVEGVLLRPLPYDAPEELAIVWQNDRATGTVREPASPQDYHIYVERSRSFAELGAYYLGTGVFSPTDGPAALLSILYATHGVPELLGLGMQRGRGIQASEDAPGAPNVAVLTDAFWRSELGADPAVVGRALTIDGSSYSVVGVLDPGADFPEPGVDVWLSPRIDPGHQNYASHWTTVVGRLAPGRTMADAQAEMSALMVDLEIELPGNQNRGAFVEPLEDVGRGDVRATLWVLFGSVVAVLLIACVNVANLLLARGAARSRELAVLSAVGAGRSQLLRRFLMEGALVALLAGVGGTVLASLGLRALLALAPAELLRLGAPGLNPPVLAFALTVTLAVGVGFALLPALQSRRLDLQAQLKDGRQGASGVRLGLRRLLVAAQLGLAVMLLIAATLLIGTVRSLQAVDPGFATAGVLRAHFTVPQARYPSTFADYPDWPEIFALNRGILDAAESVPGVERAAIAFSHPLERGFTNSFQIEGVPYDPSQGEMTTRLVTPEYAEVAGLRLVEGRFLSADDRVDAEPVIVLNREAVTRYFPDGDALGRRIGFWGPTFRTVVGIVESERVHGLTAAAPPAMYVSLLQSPQRGGELSLMMRTRVPPLSVVEDVRRAVAAVDPDVPLYDAATMEATVRDAVARERFATTALGAFAGVALLLAVLGVHGVLAYLVSQRSHEVGVRMALGATRGDVVRQVVGQGTGMAVLGILGGITAALAASGVLQGLLYGVSATSPWVYAGVAMAMALVAVAASALPARRAAMVDPVQSLRGE